MTIHNVSLFDVENVETMPRVRDMTAGPVSAADVREFARRYHYTGSDGSALWRWGLWNGAVLHGVVTYNLPTPRACRSLFGAEHGDNRVWHMGRLILSDESPRNSESRLIGASLKAIEHSQPDVWAVLTFADTGQGHIGTVYQATNALYTGTGGKPFHYVDVRGGYHDPRVNNTTITAQQAAARGWTRVNTGEKHRYIYILGNKTQRKQRLSLLRYDVLPYPKAAS